MIVLSIVPATAIAGHPDHPKPQKVPHPPAKPVVLAPPAEVAETVRNFQGNWTFDASLKAPGMSQASTFKMTFNCKPIAGGNAVSCESRAKTPAGPFEGTFLIGYDPFSKAVHFIGVTSQFEIHDHVCHWNQGVAGKFGLGCTPLKAGTGADGKELIEELSIGFHKDGKEVEFTSTSHLTGGGEIVFSGRGKVKR